MIAALAALGLLLACGGGDAPEPPPTIGAVPDRYRIVYDVETPGSPGTTDVLVVDRPFDSRLETGTSVQVSTFRRLSFTGGSAEAVVVAQPPGPAASDLRLDLALPSALVETRGRRTVAGRPCQVYRSGVPLSTGALSAPVDGERTDTCVDGAGLLLAEEYVVDGDVVLRRTATEVELEPDVDPSLFEVGDPTVPVDRGGGSVLEVEPTSRREGSFWELDGGPEGFRHRGRYAVVPPQADVFGDPMREGELVASAADVYVRGRDVVIVDQGASLGGGDPFPPVEGARIEDAGALGEVEVLPAPQVMEVRADLDGGRFVRVLGTVPVDDLLALARRLVEVEGEGLVYREGGG